MKNKFLFFSLLFVFVLLILIYPQASSATLNVTTKSASAGTSTATMYGEATTTVAGAGGEIYDGRGFNLGTASANAGNYNKSTSTASGSWTALTTGGSFNLATGTDAGAALSRGEVYYFRAYVSSSTDAAIPITYAGNEGSFLTGVDRPTNLAKTSATIDSISLSWTTTTGAHAVNVIVRYRSDLYPTSVTDGTEGCKVNGTSCDVSSLNGNSNYYFRAWASTTVAGLSTSSDAYVELTTSTASPAASTGGGKSCVGPPIFSDSLVINGGAATTESREVKLSLKASGAALMSICNNNRFLNGCILESFLGDAVKPQTKSWTLTEGDGVKTVYAVFTSDCGMNSNPISSDTIILRTPRAPTPTPTPTPAPEPTPILEVTPTPTPAPTPAPTEKPISQMTVLELKDKIAEIMVQIESLQTQLAELKKEIPLIVFEVNLEYGNKGDEVVKLQETLIKEGFLAEGLNTGWFGSLTKEAVIKFQEKYASSVLTPLGLTKGTGFVGKATRAKLNELLSP